VFGQWSSIWLKTLFVTPRTVAGSGGYGYVVLPFPYRITR
jgi:hypothetical protein